MVTVVTVTWAEVTWAVVTWVTQGDVHQDDQQGSATNKSARIDINPYSAEILKYK